MRIAHRLHIVIFVSKFNLDGHCNIDPTEAVSRSLQPNCNVPAVAIPLSSLSGHSRSSTSTCIRCLSCVLMLSGMQVTALEQRCQKLESEVQKLAQTWSEAAPTEEIKVSPCSSTLSSVQHLPLSWLFLCTIFLHKHQFLSSCELHADAV